MALAFIPIYIQFLGIEAYGLIGMLALLQGSLSLFEAGLKPAIIREMARFAVGALDSRSIKDLLRTAEAVAVAVAVTVATAIWALSDWLATSWVKPDALSVDVVSTAFATMGLVVALRLVEAVYVSSVVGLQRQVLENVISSAMATARGVGAILVLAFASPTIGAFFLWQAVVSLVTVIAFGCVIYKHLNKVATRGVVSSATLRRIWDASRGTMAIAVLAIVLTQLDKLLLSRLLPLESFSYYALASVTAGSLYLLIAPVITAFYPRFAEYVTLGNQRALRAAYHQAAQLISVVVGTGAVILIAMPDRVLLLWTANPQLAQEVAPLLSIMAFGTLLNGLMWVPYHLQLAHGWASLTAKVNAVAVVALVPAILLVVPSYGAIGAAWIWVALNAAYLTFGVYLMHRKLLPEEKRRWYLEDVAAPLCGAAVVGAVLNYAMPTEIPRAWELGTLIFGGACMVAFSAAASSTLRSKLLSWSTRVHPS